MDEKSIRVCGLNFRLGVSTLEVDALRADGSLIDTAAIPGAQGRTVPNLRLRPQRFARW